MLPQNSALNRRAMTDQDLVLATFEEYAEAYCAKDLDRLMAIFAEGEGISLIGTGRDELCSGRSAVASVFERNFRDATATKFDWGWKAVSIYDEAATVAMTLVIHLIVESQPILLPVRWTVSLIRANDGWKWIHRHASVAASSQDEGSAYPSAER